MRIRYDLAHKPAIPSGLRKLPPDIRKEARKTYRIFRADPSHPSLHFKLIHASKPIYSVRISINYRAIGVKEGDVMIWFWIGSHADYDHLIAHL
jgi:hypothetical protein